MPTTDTILRSKLAGPVLVLVLVTGVDVFAGIRGVDFGTHWDEIHVTTGLQHSVETLTFLPHAYYYGGMYFDLGYLGLSPEILRAAPGIIGEIQKSPSRPFDPKAHGSIQQAQRSLSSLISSHGFLLRLRRLFISVSALGIVWIFLAAYFATGSAWLAVAAAGAIGLSWEFSYHSRWVAVDAVLAQFAALTFLLVVLALRSESPDRERTLLRLAAAAAGLGLGSKAVGLFLLVPVFAAVLQSAAFPSWKQRAKRMTEAVAIAAAVFVATTPGAVLEPVHFADDIFRAGFEYGTAPATFTYSEPAAAVRLGKILLYLGGVVFSHYPPVAVLILSLCILGAVAGIRSGRKEVIAAVAYVLVYLAFIAGQRLLIVRNLVAILPALALLGAVGLERCIEFVSRWKPGRALLVAACAAMAAANATWILHAANTVRNTTAQTIRADLLDFLRKRPGDKFFISPYVMKALVADHGDQMPAAGVSSSSWDEADYVVIFASQHNFFEWKANIPGYAEAYFASWEVNYDYYPTWWGNHRNTRIVVLRKNRAVLMGVTPAEAAQEPRAL